MSNNLLLSALLRRDIARSLGNRLAAADGLGVEVSGDILVDKLAGSRQCLAALPDGEETDTEERAEDPDDADGDPAGEEGLAEDVAGSIHGHGPKDEESKGLKKK